MSDLDRWESRYAAADGLLFGEAPNAFLARQKPRLKPGWTALLPADGDARNGVWLAEQGLSVRSVDFCPTAQSHGRAWAERRGVSVDFELADVATYVFPEARYDVVAIVFAQFMGPAERACFFDGAARALKPGGLLLIEGYGPKQLDYATGGPKKLENLYTRALLEDAFAGFSSLEIEEYDAELHEGSAHVGPSALIDLVGVK
jgi:Cyclopropane fatty acid synthase and related methyltransferases